MLAIFVVLDLWYYRKDRLITTVGETEPPTELCACAARINLVLIAAIIGAILGSRGVEAGHRLRRLRHQGRAAEPRARRRAAR